MLALTVILLISISEVDDEVWATETSTIGEWLKLCVYNPNNGMICNYLKWCYNVNLHNVNYPRMSACPILTKSWKIHRRGKQTAEDKITLVQGPNKLTSTSGSPHLHLRVSHLLKVLFPRGEFT
jgi:hypothetical protein